MISLIIVIRKLIFASEAVARRCSVKKGVRRNFTKFTGKHLCQSFFFNKVAGVRLVTLLKKRLWHRCFPVNFVKFLRTPFLQNTFGRLLLTCDQNLTLKINSSNLSVVFMFSFQNDFIDEVISIVITIT